jgi:hypothetical protein
MLHGYHGVILNQTAAKLQHAEGNCVYFEDLLLHIM